MFKQWQGILKIKIYIKWPTKKCKESKSWQLHATFKTFEKKTDTFSSKSNKAELLTERVHHFFSVKG